MSILTFSNELKIASGWNNTAGYSLITALTDTDSIAYLLPKPFNGMVMGIDKARLSRRFYQIDTQFAQWYFEGMTIKQLYKLDNDYQQTNDGKVTVRTPDFDGTYTDFNAYITLSRAWQMLTTNTGAGVYSPANSKSNWIADVIVGFNIIGTAS